MTKSPAHFRYWKDNPQEDTQSLLFGRAVHKYVLEKDDFFNEFAVAPLIDRRTKEGKAQWLLFQDQSVGKDIITQEDFEKIQAMYDALYATPFVAKLLSGEKELSFFTEDDRTGLIVKCRPDCLTEIGEANILIDYKSCTDASNEGFMKDAIKLNYDLQLGFYKDIVDEVLSENIHGDGKLIAENIECDNYFINVIGKEHITFEKVIVECIGKKTCRMLSKKEYKTIEEFNNDIKRKSSCIMNIYVDFEFKGCEGVEIQLVNSNGDVVERVFERNEKINHTVIFIAQEKNPPYLVNILEANEYFIRSGRDMYRTYLDMYAECLENDDWYGHTKDGVNTLGLPNWLQKQYEV